MTLKNYEIKSYVTKDLYDRVRLEAVARKTKMAMIIRDSLEKYFTLQEEFASAIEIPGNLGDTHSGKIIHTLLARTEERMEMVIKDLDEKLEVSYKKLHLLIVMVDQFYLDLMQYLPKIPEKMMPQMQALAKLRYDGWLKSVEIILATNTAK